MEDNNTNPSKNLSNKEREEKLKYIDKRFEKVEFWENKVINGECDIRQALLGMSYDCEDLYKESKIKKS